jgi:glucose/arabinose dehydrogenase
MTRRAAAALVGALALTGCGTDDQASDGSGSDGPGSEATDGDGADSAATGDPDGDGRASADGASEATDGTATDQFTATEHGTFDEGWSMTFLPGTDHLLIAERIGALQLRDQATGEVTEVSGVPQVHHAGQAGMHDVIPAPSFEQDGAIYLSWVRSTDEGVQGVVGRGTLDVDAAALAEVEVLWEQTPQYGDGHFSLRMLIQDDHLFVTSGDRQELTPAQGLDTNLGKVLRLTLDGDPAPGNPWADQDGVAAEVWTLGHRNPLGIAEDSHGQMWVSEMGPQGGDELNLVLAGENYGWPEASMGVHYGGRDIPDHQDDDGFRSPAAWWVPAISPGNLLIYSGDLFDGWSDSALLGGLSGQNLVRVELDGEQAEAVDDWDMGERVREVEQAPDGAVWVLEDGPGGRLLELGPD